MVRTDSKEQKLDAFVVPRSLQLTAVPAASSSRLSHSHKRSVEAPQDEERLTVRQEREQSEEEEGRGVGMEGGEGIGEQAGVAGHQELVSEDRDEVCSMEGVKGVGDSPSSPQASTSTVSRPLTGG